MTDCRCISHNGFLTVRGIEDAQRGDDSLELAGAVASRYLDKVGSVSGLRRDETLPIWDDQVIDSQYRRFLDGS